MENIALLDPLVYGAPSPRTEEDEGEEGFSSANSLDRSMFSSLLTGKPSVPIRHAPSASPPASSHQSLQGHGSAGGATFEESYRLHRQRCPALPCSGGLYDQYGNSTDTHSHRPSTSILDLERPRPHPGGDLRASAVDAKFSELFQQGWTLSKGWRNRPRIGRIDDTALSRDIEAFAAKRRAQLPPSPLPSPADRNRTGNRPGAGPGSPGGALSSSLVSSSSLGQRAGSPGRDFGFTQRSEPRAWKDNVVVSRNYVHGSRKNAAYGEGWDRQSVPGPKYLLDGGLGRSHKTAPFSKADRFRRFDGSCGPGPALNGPRSEMQQGAVRMDTTGRQLYNSIYYDREITPAPGKLYDIRAASSQVSNVLASHGTRLPPKTSSGRLEEKLRRAKLNANPYTKLRRVREGEGGEGASYHFGNRSFEF